MPIDPQRFPAPDRPKVEIRRRAARPATKPASVAPAVVGALAIAASEPAPSAPKSVTKADVDERDEPPTIFRLVFPEAEEGSASEEPASNVAAGPAAVEPTFEELAAAESLAVDESLPKPPVAEPPVPLDPRQALLGPSEMAIPEVPTLRYDAEELAPMLEEMAVRKVLLEQTLVRMRQALSEEGEAIERDAAAIVADRETKIACPLESTPTPVRRAELGAFFWLGATIGTALFGWGVLWLLRGVLFDPALLRTGAVLTLFGLLALGSNVAIHLDALLSREIVRGES